VEFGNPKGKWMSMFVGEVWKGYREREEEAQEAERAGILEVESAAKCSTEAAG
jgi:hypothetical protein